MSSFWFWWQSSGSLDPIISMLLFMFLVAINATFLVAMHVWIFAFIATRVFAFKATQVSCGNECKEWLMWLKRPMHSQFAAAGPTNEIGPFCISYNFKHASIVLRETCLDNIQTEDLSCESCLGFVKNDCLGFVKSHNQHCLHTHGDKHLCCLMRIHLSGMCVNEILTKFLFQ